MRKIRFLLPLLGIAAALGIASVQAATSATQNVTFSVPAVVSIASNGDVAGGALSADTQKSGSFTLTSNDPAGFSITTKANSATTTESGGAGCTPASTFPAASIQFQGGTMTGQTSGTNGSAQAFQNYTTSAASVYGSNSTAQGSAITMPVTYNIKASAIPSNTGTCTYVFGTTWVIAAV